MNIEKTKKWVTKHWKKLAVGTAAVGGFAALVAYSKSTKLPIVNFKTITDGREYKDLDIPEKLTSTVGAINSYEPEEWADIWIKDSGIKLEDLGKFCEAVKELNPDFEIVQGALTACKSSYDIGGIKAL